MVSISLMILKKSQRKKNIRFLKKKDVLFLQTF